MTHADRDRSEQPERDLRTHLAADVAELPHNCLPSLGEPCGNCHRCTDPEPRRRLRSCVEAWPECHEGGYDPQCCRFPKSCSCDVYDPARVTDADLEPSPKSAEPTPERGDEDRVREYAEVLYAEQGGPEPWDTLAIARVEKRASTWRIKDGDVSELARAILRDLPGPESTEDADRG